MQENLWINGKICLVTGSSSGIGLATAWQLARLGAIVIITARDDDRGRAAQAKVIEKSDNPNVHLMMTDFASLAQVRSLANRIQAQFKTLHVLVNNAAVIPTQRQVSEDGFEMQFAVNHLAPFLLTNMLLPLLESSQPARIVNVSSDVHYSGSIDFDDLQSKRRYHASSVYSMTKLANVFFTSELDKILNRTGVTANSLHPGVINTRLYQNYMGNGGPGRANDAELERGAATSVYLASSPEVAGISGRYFARKTERKPSASSQDAKTARRLWKVSAELVGL